MRKNIPSPLQGVNLWRNEKNRFLVFEAHYTADPSKRNPDYIEPIKASMPLNQFRQEFELVWESFIGMAVYPDFNKLVHCTDKILLPKIGIPLLLGLDQGLHPAVVVGQLVENDLIIYKEYTAHNMGAERFCEYVCTQLRKDFPAWQSFKDDYILAIDPTAFNRRDVDERTYAIVWSEAGFITNAGENLWEPRRTAVEQWLIKFRRGEPCFKILSKECPVLVEGFEGGYRYPEAAQELEPTKIRPVKDKYSQPHDALQYILSFMRNRSTLKRRPIPKLGYFNR